jgi:hypothetical protein
MTLSPTNITILLDEFAKFLCEKVSHIDQIWIAVRAVGSNGNPSPFSKGLNFPFSISTNGSIGKLSHEILIIEPTPTNETENKNIKVDGTWADRFRKSALKFYEEWKK